jgi:hypothetical protein
MTGVRKCATLTAVFSVVRSALAVGVAVGACSEGVVRGDTYATLAIGGIGASTIAHSTDTIPAGASPWLLIWLQRFDGTDEPESDSTDQLGWPQLQAGPLPLGAMSSLPSCCRRWVASVPSVYTKFSLEQCS